MKEKDENEKDREKEREREKGREKDREKDREKNRDKEREKLKAKDKDRDLDKKKDRAKEPEKEGRIREHDRDRGKEQEREKERVKDSDRERDKERDKSGDKEREKKKEKDRSKKERDREKEKAGDQERIGDREKEREKHGEREKEREKVAERDKEKERENAGDREKEREKAGEREKERDRERDKEREREKEKDREREEKERQKSRLKEKERGREHERERDVRDRDREHDRDREGRDREREHDREKGRDREERDRDRIKEREFEADARDRKRDDLPSKESASSQTSAAALEERITKMREERLKANGEQKASAKKSDADDDIKSWVKKSRALEQQKRREEMEKAARMAKILSEQDVGDEGDESDDDTRNSGYGGKDLAGLKIRHGLDKVMEGGAVVLTLKDSSVLEGDDVNEAMDELENIEMAQQIAREDAYKAAKKKTGVYEDKFNNDINAAPRTILPQYDDIVKEEGVVLDETGGINEESKRKLEEARRRLENVSAKESLVSSLSVAYSTQEDMLQFKKPKKKKKLRKKDKLDLDELEAEAVAAGLGKEDLGSRNSEGRREKKQMDEKAEAEARKHAYEVARKKGEDASRLLREESTAQGMEIDEVFGGEEDEDLYKSLEKARLAALKKQKEAAGPQSIASRVVALSQQSAESSRTPDTDENRLVFTDTGEFCRSLQLDDVIIRRAGAKDAFGEADEDEEAPPVEMEEAAPESTGGWTEVSEVDKTQPVTEEEEDSTPVEEPIKEVAVGKGLAGALNLLKERGTLKETVDWGGRNMDKKRSKLVGIVDESNNEVGQRDILLDRVDEFGRTMTPKEAFRKLSHKFHGKGPGKMKQEKRMKQWQEELRLKQMNSGDTPLMSMEKMREAQAKMHTPYIVISGHIKPGQTSDPRSGFATVEKEPIGSLTPMLGEKVGSLTPMLGDKKVEHFLGIKRKAEPGSMGPPPKLSKGDRH
ncbi:hypothetical protein R1flu_028479 [Riccia fluitans]|uniref:SART-1 family protein DOT2 n=1 Tax=Riccia fluitans TaxID=41844 RepID=A0ABD1XLS7_9MARC